MKDKHPFDAGFLRVLHDNTFSPLDVVNAMRVLVFGLDTLPGSHGRISAIWASFPENMRGQGKKAAQQQRQAERPAGPAKATRRTHRRRIGE
jgi:hypothetical protein